MTETWQFRVKESIVGLLFQGARRNRKGPWLSGQELPSHVADFLALIRLDGEAGLWVINEPARWT